jgi:antitoxin component YwqK of YwqJK toxin-antitoxin module
MGLMIPVITFGQSLSQELDRRTLNLHTDTAIIETQIKIYDEHIKTKPNKTYYWYKERKIYKTQGGISGSPLDGYYEVYFSDGNIRISGFFKKGLKHKKWKAWSEMGALLYVKRYSRGVLHRKSEIFMDDTLKTECYWKGKLIRTKKKAVNSNEKE